MAKSGKKAKKWSRRPKPEVRPNLGRPTLYREEYCQLLRDHMKTGSSFATFGATLDPPVSLQTIYDWTERHVTFLEAKIEGEALAEKWWENVLKAGATGQLTRVKKREPALDGDGNPIFDAKGNPVMVEEKEPATFNATATIFALKNKFPHRWRDRKEVELGGKDGGPVTIKNMEPAQAKTAMKALAQILAEAAIDDEEEG